MKSSATSIEQYLSEQTEERRAALEAVRRVILDNLPPGYEKVMNWGMITYQAPLSMYKDTYNKKPLMYAALSSQKNYMSLYLTGIYMDEKSQKDFESAYRATGKRYDVAKSCVRFRKLDDLPLPLIARAIAAFSVDDFVKRAKEIRTADYK